jgi:hypothetical protein
MVLPVRVLTKICMMGDLFCGVVRERRRRGRA